MPWWEQLLDPSTWVLGDIATWFTGIVTAGTLFLGFSILRSDRKKAESSQARMVSVWTESERSGSIKRLRVKIWNRSNSHIFGAVAFQKKDSPPAGDQFKIDQPGEPGIVKYDLLPDDRGSVKWDFTDLNEHYATRSGGFVEFGDSDGRQWRYYYADRRLKRARKPTRGRIDHYRAAWADD